MESAYILLFAALIAVFLGLVAWIVAQRNRLGPVVVRLPDQRTLQILSAVIALTFLVQCYIAFKEPGASRYVTAAFAAFWLAFTVVARSRSIRAGGLALGAEFPIRWADVESWDWEWNARESNWTLLVRAKPGRVKRCESIDGEPKVRIEQAVQNVLGGKR